MWSKHVGDTITWWHTGSSSCCIGSSLHVDRHTCTVKYTRRFKNFNSACTFVVSSCGDLKFVVSFLFAHFEFAKLRKATSTLRCAVPVVCRSYLSKASFIRHTLVVNLMFVVPCIIVITEE